MALLSGARRLTGCLLRKLLWSCTLAGLKLHVAELALDKGTVWLDISVLRWCMCSNDENSRTAWAPLENKDCRAPCWSKQCNFPFVNREALHYVKRLRSEGCAVCPTKWFRTMHGPQPETAHGVSACDFKASCSCAKFMRQNRLEELQLQTIRLTSGQLVIKKLLHALCMVF